MSDDDLPYLLLSVQGWKGSDLQAGGEEKGRMVQEMMMCVGFDAALLLSASKCGLRLRLVYSDGSLHPSCCQSKRATSCLDAVKSMEEDKSRNKGR